MLPSYDKWLAASSQSSETQLEGETSTILSIECFIQPWHLKFLTWAIPLSLLFHNSPTLLFFPPAQPGAFKERAELRPEV